MDLTDTAEQISAMYNLGTHLLDQVIHIFDLPRIVTGRLGIHAEGRDISESSNIFTVLLHYDHDLLVTSKAGILRPRDNPASIYRDRGQRKLQKGASAALFIQIQTRLII
jgi:predicted dehydrogenase